MDGSEAVDGTVVPQVTLIPDGGTLIMRPNGRFFEREP
jgi:hypothetical protein